MSNINEQLTKLLLDLVVINEHMDQKNKLIKELEIEVEELKTKKNYFRDKMSSKIGKIEVLQAKIQKLEKADAQRKNLNAHMLLNAAESGNRNYLAEVEQLRTKVEKLGQELEKLWQDRNLAWDKGYNQGRISWHQTIVALQDKIEELEEENATLREVVEDSGIDVDEMTALKQEGTGIQDMMAEVEALKNEDHE